MRYLLVQFRELAERQCVERKTIEARLHEQGIDNVHFDTINALEEVPRMSDVYQRGYAGVLFGGSELSFDAQLPQRETELAVQTAQRLSEFITELVSSSVPSLAICFGHQVFAYVYGAAVRHGGACAKSGAYTVTLTESGRDDSLFSGCADTFPAHYMHQDAIEHVPGSATCLASGERCRYAALRYGDNSYTLQFHPELSRSDMIDRLTRYPQYLTAGQTPQSAASDTPDAHKILANFITRVSRVND